MKGRKGKGVNDAAKDMKMTPGKDSKPAAEAKERNAGGPVKKQVGGGVRGAAARANGGRAPRKSGGGCNANPLSSAAKGTPPKGHKTPGSVS